MNSKITLPWNSSAAKSTILPIPSLSQLKMNAHYLPTKNYHGYKYSTAHHMDPTETKIQKQLDKQLANINSSSQ